MLVLDCQEEDDVTLGVTVNGSSKKGLWFISETITTDSVEVLLDPEQIQVLHEQLGVYLASIGATSPTPKFRGNLNGD